MLSDVPQGFTGGPSFVLYSTLPKYITVTDDLKILIVLRRDSVDRKYLESDVIVVKCRISKLDKNQYSEKACYLMHFTQRFAVIVCEMRMSL
jgi:hypothetical protein